MKLYLDRIKGLPLFALAVALGLCGAFAQPASAVTIGFAPDAQSVVLGSSAQVDVVFSDLGDEIISAYDLDISYDAAVLNATGVLFSSALGDEFFFEVFNAFDLTRPGIVDLAQLSLLPDAALDGLQGDSVVVATLLFDAIGSGTAELDFVFDALNDVKGRDGAVLPILSDPGSIRVEGPHAAVPEPSGALLFALGALILRAPLRRVQRGALPVG